jgi:hypothetical protein
MEEEKIKKLLHIRDLFENTKIPLIKLCSGLCGFGEDNFKNSRKEIKEVIGDFECCIYEINKHIKQPPQ